MITLEQARRLAGTRGVVHAGAGPAVGSIGKILVDDASGEPTWVVVHPDDAAGRGLFLPLSAAQVRGTDIVVPYDLAQLAAAPPVRDQEQMSPAEEQDLIRYYAALAPAEARPEDVAMTRSEERLVVSTRVVARERVRLVKHIVTEYVTQTVPVRHEELRVEREPLDADEPSGATSGGGAGPAFAQDAVEVVLHEERVVLGVQVVPVERVRLVVTTRTGQTAVAADLRVENIELNVPAPSAGSLPG